MRPLSRVVAAGLLAGSLAGALALRPAPVTTAALPPTEVAVQAAAVSAVRADEARQAAAAAAAQAARAAAEARRAAAARAAAARAAARATAARAAALQAQRRLSQARVTVAHHAAPARVTAPAESYLVRGQRVYASLHYDIGRIGYRLVIRPGAAGLLGMTDSDSRTITIYVRSTTSDLVLAHTIAHEMGHAVDFTRGTTAQHLRYLQVRGLSSGLLWYGCSTCTDYRTPAGDWAEVFAQWLAGPGDFRSQLAGPPSGAQLQALSALFAL